MPSPEPEQTMNRTHRLVWNRHRNCFMVAAETANGGGGRSGGQRGILLASVLTGVLLGGSAQAAAPPAPAQLPSGAVVTAGTAQVGQSGAAMTVTQTSAKTAIEWSNFSIGKNATVTFVQPNAASIALNRVTGHEGSVIDGALKANGQVFLLNPNGVLFGKGARVDTAGLVASTLGLSDSDFLAGTSSFSGQGGVVRNAGALNAADGGYVALLGAQVHNEGVIGARLGTVALAAGDKISLKFSEQALAGVVIEKAALAALVANGGAVQADGGMVLLSAKSAEGLLDTVINNSGEVRARTIAQRDGKIFLLGEGGAVEVGGRLDASAPDAGKGGFIETSGPRLTVAAGAAVGTRAASGENGTWLIDPTDFAIDAGAASQGASGMGAATLQAALAAGNVTIQTQAAGAEAGDIHINAPLAWNANKLTLEAHGNINVNAVIGASGASTLDLKTGYNFNPGTPAFNTGKNVLVGIDGAGAFKGRIDIDRAGAGILAINNLGYTLINALGNASSTTSLDLQGMNGGGSGRYALAANIDASATSAWNSGAGFGPVAFSGTFDGLGHTVSGLSINQPAGSYVGLFGTNNGTVRNVALANASVTANQGVGALIGLNMGSVYNSYASAAVNGPGGYVGGLIGAIFDGTLSNLHVSGSVTSAGNNVGGLTGYLAYQINLSNSYASNAVTNSVGVWTGGLVGQNDYGRIIDSYATGNVIGKGDTGGLVGNNNSGLVSGSYATGTVSGTTNAGGLVGNNNNGKVTRSHASGAVSGNSTVGGLIGLSSASGGVPTPDNEINTSYATGAVSATADNVGGLIGRNFGNHVLNAYARGAVNSNGNYVGGLIGNNLGTADKTYSTGAVSSGGVGVGGLMGVSIGGVSNSFWDTQTSGQNSSGDGTGRTSAQMKDSLTFTASTWDFTFHSGVWGRKDSLNDGYPVLRTFGYTDQILITLANPALSKTYGAANPALGAGAWSVSGCDNNAACIGALDWGAAVGPTTPVGSYSYLGANVLVPTLGAGYGKLSDYDITIAPGALAVTPAPLTLSGANVAGKVYDRTTAASFSSGTLAGLVNGENLTLSGSGVFDSPNAGLRSVSATLALADGSGANAGLASNYQLTGPATVTLSATISPRPVDVSVSGTRPYNASASVDASLLQLGDVLSGDSVTLGGSATLSSANAGTQTLASLSGLTLNNPNYGLAGASASGSLTITPLAVGVSGIPGAARPYDGSALAGPSLLAVSGLLGGDSAALSGSVQLAGKDVGANAITGLGTLGIGNSNYTLNGVAPAGSVQVTPLALALGVRPQASRPYDGSALADASLLQVSNALPGEQLSLSGKAILAGKDAGSQALTGLGDLSVSNSNYILSGALPSGVVLVTPLALQVALLPGAAKRYDGNASAPAALMTVNGVLAGESAILGGSARLAGKDVGNQAILDWSGLTLNNGNYRVGATSGGSVAITARPLNLALAANASRVYDGTSALDPALLRLDGALEGEQVGLRGQLSLAGKDVGQQALAGIAGLALDNPNYVLAGVPGGTVNITARTLGVSTVPGASRVYDGGSALAPTLLQLQGVLAGDTASLGGSAQLAGKDAGTQAVASLAGLTVNNSNYTLAGSAPQGSVAIGARPLTIVAPDGTRRLFDGSARAAADLLRLDGVLAGDSVVLGGSAVLSGIVGRTSITGLDGLTLSNGNYTLDGGATSGTVQISQIDNIADAQRTTLPDLGSVLAQASFLRGLASARSAPLLADAGASLPRLGVRFGNGVPLMLQSSPEDGEASDSLTLEQARRLLQKGGGAAGKVRVPVSRNGLAEIVDGGVRLPPGVDQLLFVVKAP
ncbi:filamentous hemagglutinin N-terminal domain-containing protein [Massilia sp. CCM 8692]|uniref:Filamentous hemagglutinin N-terminal domain-containing protein n=2 Tax=Massilia rubra TaxID=2607910 RepID=A0ABX0LR77_9BURK|nr:filamentous hemagglutinin N-terminal domain-containing protein [Massilia rubra]